MALATTCPACSTSFKVNPEQLKLRRGLVRCGKCDHVFSGVEYLRYVSDSRTDEELNEDNDADDRRRGDRRGTGRRLWGNTEPSATDELKTAFFLPDTELGPEESAAEGPGNVALKTAGDNTDSDAADAKDNASADSKQAASADASSDAEAKSADDASKESDDASNQSESANGKRNRRSGARGKRGRGRRKRAAAREQTEQDAGESNDKHQDKTDVADPKAPAASEPAGATAASDANQTDPSAPKDAETEDKPPEQPNPPTTTPAKDEKSASAESQKPSPFSARSQTRAGSVITSPLTKGARGDFQKTGRDDDWPTAPVWPKIDEHFDEPDIEEPDTRPGPASADAPDSSDAAQDDRTRPSSRAKGKSGSDGQTALDGVDPAAALADADDAHALATPAGPHEEDAIDFFGQASRPTFDFDLPPRQVLVIAGGLVVLLLLQLAVGNRDVLASRFPAFGSGLAAISAPFGLKVELPMNREEIKIASFDLTAASSREPDASYVMNLLMRNNARYKLRWPAIELTLLDGVGGILVRKVLMPAEYLPNESMIAAGLAGSSEQPIRVALKSSTDAPIGYSVSLFYP